MQVWEIPIFIVLGCLGGLIGVAFNLTNKMLTIKRKKWFGFTGTVSSKQPSRLKVLEALAVSLVVSVVTFTLPLCWDMCSCNPYPAGDSPFLDACACDPNLPFCGDINATHPVRRTTLCGRRVRRHTQWQRCQKSALLGAAPVADAGSWSHR